MQKKKKPQPKTPQLQALLFAPGTNITLNSNRLENYL